MTTAPVSPEEDEERVIERADGFYWQDKLTAEEAGPFLTRSEALQDMEKSRNGFGDVDCDPA